MSEIWSQLRRFVRGLFHRPEFTPTKVEDSPETVMETERRRGVRGF